MIEYLKRQIAELQQKQALIDSQTTACNQCKSISSIDFEKIAALRQDYIRELKKHHNCNCRTDSNGKTKEDYFWRIENIEHKISVIECYIPPDFQDIDITLVDKRILTFFENEKNILWLHGKTGTGKTASVYALAIRLLLKGLEIQVRSENDIDYTHIPWIVKEKIFCYDDLWRATNSDRLKSIANTMLEIIDKKRANRTKLVITSNYSPEQWITEIKKISANTAGQLSSRMSNTVESVEVKGHDRRKK